MDVKDEYDELEKDFIEARLMGGNSMLIGDKDGTVTDISTGLMWQQTTAPGIYTWEQALEYCKSLDLAGFTDWRLPTIKELASIVDYSRYKPAIDTDYFPDTVEYYWSSTTYVNNTYGAWYVYFYNGNINYGHKSKSYYVRAVRDGQRPEVGKEVGYEFYRQ